MLRYRLPRYPLRAGLYGLAVMGLVACSAPPAAPQPTAAPAKPAATTAPAAAPASPAAAQPTAKPAAAAAQPSPAAAAQASPAAAKPTAAPAAAKPTGPLKKITVVSATPQIDAANAYMTIAQQMGYFAQEGLDVTLQPSQGGGGAATQLVATGGAEFATPLAEPMLTSLANGVDLGLIFVYNIVRDAIQEWGVVKQDSPIKDYADLKGKKIGVLGLTPSSLAFPQAVLRLAGVDPERDVQFIAVGRGSQAGLALQNGEIDALFDTDQSLAQLEPLGFNFRALPRARSAEDTFGSGLVVRRDYYEANKQTTLGVARALAKGTVFLLTNPEAAIQVHWKAIPETKPRDAKDDAEAVKMTMVSVKPRVPKYDVAGERDPRWGAYHPADVQATLDFLGFADKIKEPSKYFLNDLVEEVNKTDMEAVRQQARNWKP